MTNVTPLPQASPTTPVAPSDELPVARVADLALVAAEHQWLVRDVWGQGAVGFVGGAPKCAKSWYGLDLALSVASGTPFLGRFEVRTPGSALVFRAEDALPQVRERLAGLAAHRGLDLGAVDVHVVTASAVLLDLEADRLRLEATVARLQPKIVVLDPLVRLHRMDQNSAAHISVLLGFLRDLSRRHRVAIVIVHHMTKRGHADLGQGLRGSGDLHAWHDHASYLVRRGEKLRLVREHRSAPAPQALELRLVSHADGIRAHLEIVGAKEPEGSRQDPAPSWKRRSSRPLQNRRCRLGTTTSVRRSEERHSWMLWPPSALPQVPKPLSLLPPLWLRRQRT